MARQAQPQSNGTAELPRTKIEAVRRALSEGRDDPAEGSAYVRSAFGIEMTPKHFSTYKSQLRKTQRRETPRRAAPPAGAGFAVSLDDLRRVRDLCARLGADRLKRLVASLS